MWLELLRAAALWLSRNTLHSPNREKGPTEIHASVSRTQGESRASVGGRRGARSPHSREDPAHVSWVRCFPRTELENRNCSAPTREPERATRTKGRPDVRRRCAVSYTSLVTLEMCAVSRTPPIWERSIRSRVHSCPVAFHQKHSFHRTRSRERASTPLGPLFEVKAQLGGNSRRDLLIFRLAKGRARSAGFCASTSRCNALRDCSCCVFALCHVTGCAGLAESARDRDVPQDTLEPTGARRSVRGHGVHVAAQDRPGLRHALAQIAARGALQVEDRASSTA